MCKTSKLRDKKTLHFGCRQWQIFGVDEIILFSFFFYLARSDFVACQTDAVIFTFWNARQSRFIICQTKCKFCRFCTLRTLDGILFLISDDFLQVFRYFFIVLSFSSFPSVARFMRCDKIHFQSMSTCWQFCSIFELIIFWKTNSERMKRKNRRFLSSLSFAVNIFIFILPLD